MKLTKAQRQLLVDAADECGTYYVPNYRPAVAMVRLGLVKWEDGNKGNSWLNITPAGRAALEERGDG